MLAVLLAAAPCAAPAAPEVSFVDPLDVAPKLKPRQLMANPTQCPICTSFQNGAKASDEVVCLKKETPAYGKPDDDNYIEAKNTCTITKHWLEQPCDGEYNACMLLVAPTKDMDEEDMRKSPRVYVEYTPKPEKAEKLVVPGGKPGKGPAPADHPSGNGQTSQPDQKEEEVEEDDEFTPLVIATPWKGIKGGKNMPEASPEPGSEVLSQVMVPMCHCDLWLEGGTEETIYRCVKVEAEEAHCKPNYGKAINQCGSDWQAQVCGPPEGWPKPPPSTPPPSLPHPPFSPPVPPGAPPPPGPPPAPPDPPSTPSDCVLQTVELEGKIAAMAEALLAGEETKYGLMKKLAEGGHYAAMASAEISGLGLASLSSVSIRAESQAEAAVDMMEEDQRRHL